MINSKPLHYYPYQFTTNKSHINPKYVLYTKVYNSQDHNYWDYLIFKKGDIQDYSLYCFLLVSYFGRLVFCKSWLKKHNLLSDVALKINPNGRKSNPHPTQKTKKGKKKGRETRLESCASSIHPVLKLQFSCQNPNLSNLNSVWSEEFPNGSYRILILHLLKTLQR